MRIGFIGAGKMGFTLGKHLREAGFDITGYYSSNIDSSRDAADFTNAEYYSSINDLVQISDIIFLTVPDGQISKVLESINKLNVMQDKIVCHTSGALSSEVFFGMDNIFGYSIHPIYAVNSKLTSYVGFSDCFITIEGNSKYLCDIEEIFTSSGHKVKIIDSGSKVKYHAASVFASNLVVGLYSDACELLKSCGFSPEEQKLALNTLFMNNARSIVDMGVEAALTGPIERNDISTVRAHIDNLHGRNLVTYKQLSSSIVDIASKRHPDRDYEKMSEVLK